MVSSLVCPRFAPVRTARNPSLRGTIRPMGGARVVLVALAVLLLAAPAALAGAPPFVDWNPLLPSGAPNSRPSRAKDCADGRRSCIEQTLGQMYARFDRRYASCDHN